MAAEESNFRRAALRLDTNPSSRGMSATSKKSWARTFFTANQGTARG
jgi:hypothetical protein